MPTPTPSPLANAHRTLAAMLAASPTWQARLGVDSATAAATRIHHHRDPSPPAADQQGLGLKAHRPFAVIMPSADFAFPGYAGGSQNWHHPRGELALLVEDEDQHPGDSSAGYLAFADLIGGIMADLATQSGKDDNLPLGTLRFLVPPTDLEPEDQAADGNFWWCLISVPWGSEEA
jgi:hypothetical protein